MTKTLDIVDDSVLAQLDARTNTHSIDTEQNGIATRDLGRYYAAIGADLAALTDKFNEAERMAVIETLQPASRQRNGSTWQLLTEMEGALQHGGLAEQFEIDSASVLEKVSSLTRSEMTAFSDAAERWWNATVEGSPERGDLFVGIPRVQ